MSAPPYVDRFGEHWIGSYDTDEEDAIAAEEVSEVAAPQAQVREALQPARP